MILEKTITTYKMGFRHVERYTNDLASIRCFSEDVKTELLIVFYQQDEERMKARIDTLPNGKFRIVVQFPILLLSTLHHFLQTEMPLRVYANNNNDYTQVVFGTADYEKVGENERFSVWG